MEANDIFSYCALLPVHAGDDSHFCERTFPPSTKIRISESPSEMNPQSLTYPFASELNACSGSAQIYPSLAAFVPI